MSLVLVLILALVLTALPRLILRLAARRRAAEARERGWAELKEESYLAAVRALTVTDIEILTGLGWVPPHEIKVRIQTHRRNEHFRQAKEAKEKAKAAAAAAPVPSTPEELTAYKARPLAVRQAEANENITGDPTVYGREPALDRALANIEAAHKLALAGVIRTGSGYGFSSGGFITPDARDPLHYEAVYVAEKAEPVAYLPRY